MAEVSTRVIPDPHGLLTGLPERDLTCWVRQGQGMVGFGVAHARTFTSAAQADAWWRDLADSVTVERDKGLAEEPMAQLVAFVSFPFAPDGAFEVVVPQVVIGRRHGLAWATTWGDARWRAPDQAKTTSAPSPRLTFQPGSLDRDHWLDAVHQLVARIRQGQVDKVVLARDELAVATHPIDVRPVLARLATAYPQTWTFCVKNLVGASPELLVRQDGGRIASRVLAGTIPGDRDHTSLAAALSSSSKDLAEHEYAVASVARALRGHVWAMHVPDEPFVLRLPNVMHLASDITGRVRDGSVLQLADLIHPSAAVCGTPTDKARALIGAYEGMDRGRYAGPIGWVNTDGDGEIALALRCGLIEGENVRIFAGCGIVADSDASAEWYETIAKFLPMKQALLAV